MTFGCVGPGSITLVSGFRYFVLSAFRYFVFFSVFTVSGIRSGEGIGSRPAVGCLTRLSVAAADATTLRRAGLFRLMPVFTGFGFSIFRFSVSRYRWVGGCGRFLGETSGTYCGANWIHRANVTQIIEEHGIAITAQRRNVGTARHIITQCIGLNLGVQPPHIPDHNPHSCEEQGISSPGLKPMRHLEP